MKGTIHNKFAKLGKYGIGGDQEQSCHLEETPVSPAVFFPRITSASLLERTAIERERRGKTKAKSPVSRRLGFPGSSVSCRIHRRRKESTCNAGNPGSIPGLGRSPGEGNGNLSGILARRIAHHTTVSKKGPLELTQLPSSGWSLEPSI